MKQKGKNERYAQMKRELSAWTRFVSMNEICQYERDLSVWTIKEVNGKINSIILKEKKWKEKINHQKKKINEQET